MSHEIEKEQTYLLAELPADIANWQSGFLADTYIPANVANPQIRLRQRGETYFLTKKYPKDGVDLSVMIEETISLSEAEYAYFRKNVPGNYLAKTRYKKESNGIIIEVDAYQDALSPLILVDFEWTDHMPGDELLAQFKITQNVTQINELAGGQLAGKTYEQIAKFIAN